MKRSLVLFLAFVTLTTGCKVGPDYVEPEVDVNEAWLDEDDPRVSDARLDDAAWWRTFDDPVLDELVEVAMQQNLDLRVAGLRVLEAMAQRGIAVGEFFPQTQAAVGGVTRERFSDETAAGAAPRRYSTTYDAGFEVAWELDFWGRFRRQIEAADADLEVSLADYDTVMVALVAEVASTYMQVRTLEEQLEAARLNVGYQERSLDLTQAKWDAGATSALDLEFSTAILRETEAVVPRLETQLAQTKYVLAFLLGRPPGDLSELLGPPATVPQAPVEVAVGIPGDLLRRRPDVRGAERAAAAQSARVGVAEADFYPAISIAGSIGRVADDAGDLSDGGATEGSIGPSFAWPILNYGRIENNVRVQDAVYQEFIVSYRSTVLQAASEVEDGLVGFLKGQQTVERQSQAAAAAERAVQIALDQYEEGEAGYAVVLLALEFLVEAKNELALDRGDVAQSLVATYKALGGGWEVSAVPLVPFETEAELRARREDWGELLSSDYAEGSDLGFERPEVAPAADREP